MLVLGRKPQETVVINGNIKVIVLGIQGQQVRLGFEAPEDIEIHREEIFEKIQQEKADAHSAEHEAD